jgi:hypothetical protein
MVPRLDEDEQLIVSGIGVLCSRGKNSEDEQYSKFLSSTFVRS